MRSAIHPWFFAALVMVSSGCASPPAPSEDAGRDAAAADAAPMDARATDAGSDAATDGATDSATTDTAIDAPVDAPGADDGGADAAARDTGIDAASTSDAGSDAANASDAGIDSGRDAGMDAASTIDAGSDGGHDAGMDAASAVDANVTTCSILVSPPRGTSSGSFTFTVLTNGSACSASLDGSAPLSVPCTGSTSLNGFSIGTHTVRFDVGSGPSGAATCSASFDVVGPDAGTADGGPDASVTTCTIHVAPSSGSASTTFTATFASNGAGCALAVDGLTIASTPCDSAYSGAGTLLGTGSHTATLTVTSGPGGGTSCSDTFTVTP